MTESLQQRKEIDAFFNFFATFCLGRSVTTLSDLSDGAALFEILSLVYVSSLPPIYLSWIIMMFSAMQTTSGSRHACLLSPLIIGSFASAP